MGSKNFFDALDGALDLEIEGHEFYMRCAEHTRNREGQEFFRYLAGEELIHHDKIAGIYRNEFKREYHVYRDRIRRTKKVSGVFEEKVPGGNLDEKSGAFDTLNIALKVEDKSIKLYSRLARESENPEIRSFFKELVREEENHRSLLETEIEFVTETGSFKDFRVVTS